MEIKFMHAKVSRQTLLIDVCSVMRLRFYLLNFAILQGPFSEE